MRGTPVKTSIEEMSIYLADRIAVAEKYPDAIVNYHTFYSKSVNADYTNYTFEKNYNGLFVIPYSEISYEHNNVERFVKIFSMPRANKLVHLTWRRHLDNKKRIMKFARFAINQKNHKFRDEMLNTCKAEIMNFVKNNPNYHIDTTHLEPRLKKLMVFT